MEWIVIVSVLVMTILCLLRVNVIIAIIAASIVAGLMAGLSLVDSIEMMVSGMGAASNTALSYILLGAFAVAISYTGITTILVNFLIRKLTGKKTMLVLAIAGVACLSQNAVPVHIAFIPILIPPLLKLFDEMRLDRRAVASALTFGLKAPYIMIPAGFGLLFQGIIEEGMIQNGTFITENEVSLAMLIPGSGMIVGLFIAIFITYRKDRDAIPGAGGTESTITTATTESVPFNKQHLFTIIAILGALAVQLVTQNLIAGALTGLVLMFLFFVIPFKKGDKVMTEGIGMMGTIAFVMLVASGYGEVLNETGAVEALVELSSGYLNNNKVLIAFILLLVGLLITMGIGSSFGTIPIIAALYVPICIAAGFSPMATAALIGTAGALGDAGSPASDSTLGPTSGLNADGKHHHIWDTCVPTFLHYNIPLFIFGWIAALIL
ncbi:Na+/H+ antiporter NhaC family protein [Oceanobacillus profundus]|uniref:TRAP transporter large permease subunit n=1 Tax=Oceanobacillus profundus TaxID=372463 RepID=A0A417YAG5_9BACI|nr:Na+/H+ antiporter NhaC family protein [Oceanobacillus profundus]MBR3118034.1 TRAP transporter large permease subunit [Oceanobacillus sp.]MDO6448757.1 SLC13 family permease [Oceanobacillus profundus]PAE27476.1 sodium:proton antiporter [Paenibacillus sp. 7884-2]RHW29551.1 TRAP transporter large permease subunit [Oceanobacillus profundus]